MADFLKSTGIAMSAAFLSLAAGIHAANAGSQYVVVSAEPAAESYQPGKILNVGDKIIIPAGTVVTLLGEDGSVNAIPGPVSITVTEDAVETVAGSDVEKKRSTISKIAGLLAGEKKNADSLGVARSMNKRPKPRGLDDPWVISMHTDGNGCAHKDEVRLGRKADTNEIDLTVTGDEGSEPFETKLEKGVSEVVVPDAVPMKNGEIFVKSGRNSAVIVVHQLPGEVNPQNPVDVLGWMIEKGCEGQALAFTRQLVLEAQ